ncbi:MULTISPECIES: BON domain-containing protein [Oxalobacteraceae]|uniref:BON domain-containing protein n=1 Tax=Herminiimonas sp. Marseille-P9896 TaxID=2742211 RepID=UPI0015893326|nr:MULTISPECIES: BON domain-containing protein [Oxalobacteraceae]
MKYVQRAVALAFVSAFLAGCASTATDTKSDAKPAPAATPAPAAAPAAAAPAAAPSPALQKAVEATLAKESELKGTKIAVAATADGAVTLSGTVKNDWQQYLAGETAKKAAGVKSVKNSIKVPD